MPLTSGIFLDSYLSSFSVSGVYPGKTRGKSEGKGKIAESKFAHKYLFIHLQRILVKRDRTGI